MNSNEFFKKRNKVNGVTETVRKTTTKPTQASSVNSKRTTQKGSSPVTEKTKNSSSVVTTKKNNKKMNSEEFFKKRDAVWEKKERYRKLGVSKKMGGIVDTALGKEWANTPYVWGGTSTNGADCSGFVQSVFKQNGVNISRTTSTQINDGTPVDLKDLKIGDLVFYGKGSPSHVGIYIGNGLVRHSGGGDERNTASNPGKGVQTSPINYRSDFYGARRIDTGDAVPVEELGATKNNAQKKTTTFLDDTNNAYQNAKDNVNNKNVVVNSDMSENERKARIKEIDDELKRIGAIRMGFRRGGGVSDSVVSEYEEKAKKLQQEKKSLERVGTFTSSQLKQFEIDDAKAEKAKLPAYNPTARVMPHQVEEYKANIAAHSEADKKIDTLKRQKTLYKDITKYGDDVHEDNFGGQWSANYRSSELSREADKAMSEYIRNPTEENKQIAYAYDAFAKEYAKNNAKALDDENVKASWLTKSMAGYLPQLRDQIAPELIGGGIGLMFGGTAGASIGAGLATYAQSYEVIQGSVYRTLLAEGVDEKTALSAAQDEALISSLIEGGETALGWLISGGGKALSAIGAAAKTSVAKGSTNAAVKFMAGLGGKTVDRAAKKAVNAVTRPLWKTGLRVAGGIVGNGLTEYGEEFAQGAVSIANHEKAYKTVKEEIGQYGMGNVNLYQRPVYTNADGSISTVDSVTFEIDGKFVLLPTIARDENGKVIRLETDEEILAHFGETGEFLGEFDTLEEANAYATKLHTAQAYLHSQNNGVTADDSLWSGGAKVVKNALSGNNKEALSELHGQGMEGFKIGLMMGGSQTIANNIVAHYANAKTVKNQNEIADTIIADEESLNALIDEGKASGEGTVSYDIAEEIEASREKGKVTRGQVKRLIASNEIYIANEEATEQDTLEGAARYVVENREQSDDIGRETRNTPTHTGFGSLSHEEVKQASGFGDNGARLLTEVASEDGMTFFKARDAIKGAYFAGYTGNDIAVRNDLERQAKLAGIDDRIADNNIAKENALNTKIYKGTFTENEYTANWSKATKRMVSTVAKSFGMDVATVDKIISEGVNGEKTEANASHINGKMVISKNADPQKTIHALVLHESGHRMEQFATDEWNTLANYLYNRAEQMDRRVKLGNYKGMEFDAVKGEHDNAGILMSTEGYVGEIAVRELETIFESPEEFNKWYAEISGNPQVRTAWEKIMDFITELIDDIKKAISNARMTKAERAETRKSVAELERIKELYTEAYKATERAVEERKTAQNKQGNDKNSEKNLEIKTNEEYNENISYSLKDNGKSEQYGVMWTLESGVLNKSEVSAFYNKISEMRNNKYKNYKISRDGNYIFEIGNKLVYTDGYYASPAIYDVITFDTNDETILGDARRFIYDAEETGASQETTLEIIEVIYGEAFARATSFEDSRTDEGKNGRREGTDSRENSSRDENGINKYFSLKGTDINTKDRQQLLDTIEQLKHEFEVTKFAKADSKKLTKMTKNILKEYSSYADFDETFNAIDALYQYMANGEDGHPAVWEDVYNRAYEIAQGIVKEALVVDDYMYQEYKSLRNYLRTTPMKFDSDYDSSPIAYDDFNSFRKSNFGRLKFSKNGLPIDAVYKELSHLYPEFFNEERDNNTADQLERIVDVLDEIQPTDINPFDREFEQVSMYLANDITSRFFDIPQAKPTFADKAERRVVQANIKGAKKVEAVRQQRDEKIKKTIEIQKEKTKKKLDKIREQRDEKVKKEQQKRIEAISKMSENQKAKVYRARIERHASDLSKKLISPTDKQHIPDELQGAVAKLLECINLESNYTYDTESHSYKKNDDGLPSKRTKAFEELRKLYKNIADSVVVDPDLMGEDGLLSDVIVLADKRIVDMNSSELDTVWNALRAVEASVSNANKMFSKGKYETISEVAETLRKDNAGKKEQTEYKGVIGKSKRLATLYMLTPETYLHQLGSAGDSIFRMMRDAQDKHISIMKEVADFTNKTLKGINVNSLEKTLHTVKLGGESIQLSTAQLMELYVLMKREQAVEHILVGGILPDVTEGKWLKQNTKAKPVRNISVDEISTATAKLTDEQKKIADKLQRYVSDVLSAYGNEASMKVYNYEKFLEKNYWPIRTNKQEINTEIGKNTSVTSVAGKGMAKGTKPHANTSVRIGSIFDSFSAHSSDMATYAAWLGTSEDVNRIRNFVFWEKGARKGTVKDILDTVHGMEGSNYLEKLLTDIAIGVKGTDNMNPFDKVIGNYKAASVGGNIRVVIQQPTAILRAMDMINACYLAEGAVKPLKGWEKAKKYAPIAQWKSWGYFDINTGRQMKDILFNNASFIENTKQVGMWGASMADSLAWGQLWNAVEAETKAKHKDLEAGSEEYYETVTKRFTEIVDHTQVVDGILQRSQIMRSPDMLTKMATSFMGEPTKQYNMAVSAAYDAMNTKGDARKKAIVRLGRTAMSLAVASIVNACAQSIIDAMRDNDKEKRYWEKWLTALVGDGEDTKLIDSNLGEAIIPFNYVPFFKDIVSIMQGYDVKRMDAEAIIKTISAVTNMIKAVAGTSKYTVAEASAQLFAEIARLFGVPVSNVKRDTKSLVMSIATATDSYILQYRIEKAMLNINYAGNRKNFMEILFNAYNNDREAYQLIYYDMIESGYDSDKIKSGLESRMKNAEGVKSTSDLSKRYMTPTDEKKYDSSMRHIQSNDLWKTATEEQRKGVKADLYNFLTSDSDYMSKTREETKAAGVDETEYILWKLAIEMADQPKGKEGSGYYDYKEKAEAINSLDLGDEEIAYFFGRGLNEYAKQELIKVQNDGIDLNTYVNFKAATSDMEADKDANGKSVPNSKKKKIVNYLNSADLTDEEWQYFYYEIMKYKR